MMWLQSQKGSLDGKLPTFGSCTPTTRFRLDHECPLGYVPDLALRRAILQFFNIMLRKMKSNVINALLDKPLA